MDLRTNGCFQVVSQEVVYVVFGDQVHELSTSEDPANPDLFIRKVLEGDPHAHDLRGQHPLFPFSSMLKHGSFHHTWPAIGAGNMSERFID
jgi:hypothetical protein